MLRGGDPYKLISTSNHMTSSAINDKLQEL